MADQRVENIRSTLRRVLDVGIGAALAFGLAVAATLAFPRGVDLLLWGVVLGFSLLLVISAWILRARLSRVETEVQKATQTGEKLKGEIARREQAEAELQAEELFPFYNPGPVLRFDRTGRINRYNPAAADQVGYGRLSSLPVTELIPGVSAADVATCIDQGRIEAREVKWGERWFVCHFRGVPDLGMGMVYASDVTAIKQAEIVLREQDTRTRAILDGAAEAILIVEAGGRVQAANPAAAKLFGKPLSSLIGELVPGLIPSLFEGRGGDPLEVLIGAAKAQAPGAVSSLYTGRRSDGSTFPASMTISVYEADGVTRCSCFVRDATERIRNEQQQREQAARLAEQNQRLEQLVTELNEFAYVASHDLQEPLRTMSAYCGLLQKDMSAGKSGRVDEDLQAILDASLRMQRLITNLLEYSRSGYVELLRRPVDLGRVLARVKEDLRGRLDESGGTLDWKGLPTVPGDEQQLGRVFLNLVANGLKFHRKSEVPAVLVTAEIVDGFHRVTVEDNGIGIAGPHASQVFQPFKRLNRQGEYEGTGIGLSICRKIVERHGGRIEVQSESGEGSRFTVILPVEKTGS